MASNRKDVFVITPPAREGDKPFWRRCGVAWVNRDSSLNVRLDLFPGIDLQIRTPKERTGTRK